MSKIKKIVSTIFINVMIVLSICLITNVHTIDSVIKLHTISSEVESEVEQEIQEDNTSKEWTEWVQDNLIPNLIDILSILSILYVTLAPLIVKIKKSSNRFDKATKDICDSSRNSEQSLSKVAKVNQRLDNMEQKLANIEQMVRIGFVNNNELVSKGFANEIAQIGVEKNEQEQGKKAREEREEEKHPQNESGESTLSNM